MKNTKTRTGFGRRIKRGFAALALTFGLMAGVPVATAAPAVAEGSYNVLYHAWPTDVCAHQGNFSAITLNPLDPYSLRCYDLSIPMGFSIGGDLDIQGYCNDKYPGSVASPEEHNAVGWYCKRAETP